MESERQGKYDCYKTSANKKTNQQQHINISCLILPKPKFYTTNIHALNHKKKNYNFFDQIKWMSEW